MNSRRVPTSIDDLSDKAKHLLETALECRGLVRGYIVFAGGGAGVLHIASGTVRWRAYGEAAVDAEQQALRELLDHRLIVALPTGQGPAGYMVTPSGCEIAWGLNTDTAGQERTDP